LLKQLWDVRAAGKISAFKSSAAPMSPTTQQVQHSPDQRIKSMPFSGCINIKEIYFWWCALPVSFTQSPRGGRRRSPFGLRAPLPRSRHAHFRFGIACVRDQRLLNAPAQQAQNKFVSLEIYQKNIENLYFCASYIAEKSQRTKTNKKLCRRSKNHMENPMKFADDCSIGQGN